MSTAAFPESPDGTRLLITYQRISDPSDESVEIFERSDLQGMNGRNWTDPELRPLVRDWLTWEQVTNRPDWRIVRMELVVPLGHDEETRRCVDELEDALAQLTEAVLDHVEANDCQSDSALQRAHARAFMTWYRAHRRASRRRAATMPDLTPPPGVDADTWTTAVDAAFYEADADVALTPLGEQVTLRIGCRPKLAASLAAAVPHLIAGERRRITDAIQQSGREFGREHVRFAEWMLAVVNAGVVEEAPDRD